MVLSAETIKADSGARATEFWADLEEGERDGWLCSGVVCCTVVGRKPA